MGDATFALVYAVFAVLFCVLNITSEDPTVKAGIYRSVAGEYSRLPWTPPELPPQRLTDVSGAVDLLHWLYNVVTDVTFREQKNVSDAPAWANVSNYKWNHTYTPATVGSFNRILMVRFTTKRWKLESTGDTSFAKSTYRRVKGAVTTLSARGFNPKIEESSKLCSVDGFLTTNFTESGAQGGGGGPNGTAAPNATNATPNGSIPVAAPINATAGNASGNASTNGTAASSALRCYEYQMEGSFSNGGGYTFYLDPQMGRAAFQAKLAQLDADGFFDPLMASFALDLMVYNANTNRFMQMEWVFTFDFAGNCHKDWNARYFKLNLGDYSDPALLMQTVLRAALGAMICMFAFIELRKASDAGGFFQHFSKMGAKVDMASLMLCAVVLVNHAVLMARHSVNNFNFDSLFDPSTQSAVYQDLEDTSRAFQDQTYIVGLNLLIVFVRAVVLVAHLQTDLGLILKVMDTALWDLVYFAGMFLMVFAGFVGMAFFTFGPHAEGLSQLAGSLQQCFAMMTGVQIYPDLQGADEVMGPLFYFAFYTLFYLVMLNTFVSILLSAYDFEDFKLVNRGHSGHEQGLLGRITQELYTDVFQRCWRYVAASKDYIEPITRSAASSLYELAPGVGRAAVLLRKRKKKRGHDAHSDPGSPSDAQATDPGSEAQPKEPTAMQKFIAENSLKLECSLMSVFMIIFLFYATFLTGGEASLFLSQAVLREPNGYGWLAQNPERSEAYATISSFEDVGLWTDTVVRYLYSQTYCVVADGRGHGSLVDVSGVADSCWNGNDSEKLVQRLQNWNIGFLNTTFVRLTVQPACYVVTPEARWADGLPVTRVTPVGTECAQSGCVDVLQQYRCRTGDGLSLDVLNQNLSSTSNNFTAAEIAFGKKYNWSDPEVDLGSSQMLGGFVFGFGKSMAEFEAAMKALRDGGFFSKNSASMVFDWITYNGNQDLFTYTVTGFSLLGTGEMVKYTRAQTFPMNLLGRDSRSVQLALFSMYSALVLYYVVEYVARMRKDLARSPSVRAFLSQFFGDYWMLCDGVSITLSLISMIIYSSILLHKFRGEYRFSLDSHNKYEVPNDDVKKFVMPATVDPTRVIQDDWYIFMQFEALEGTFGTCLTMAAFNAFFICVKIVKYAGELAWVQPFSYTLHQGRTRTIYFSMVMGLAMLGFSFFFHILFGATVPGMGTFSDTFLTLFKWVCGIYDLTALIEADALVALLFFLVFMMMFYFIAINMFLATMLNTYSKQVGDLDITRAEQMMTIRECYFRKKEDFKEIDMQILEGDMVVGEEFDEGGGGPAARAGVKKGNIILKINGDAFSWRKDTVKRTLEALKERQRGGFRVVFKDHSNKKKGWLFWKSSGGDEALTGGRVTVNNFWSDHGAVAAIAREAGVEATDGGTLEGEGEEDDDDGDQQAVSVAAGPQDELDVDDAIAGERNTGVKGKMKARLEGLLFSRWLEGRHIGAPDGAAVQPGRFWEVAGVASEEVSVFDERTWDLDELKDRIDRMPVSGHETWLDFLMLALEREMADDDSLVADVLRTGDISDVALAFAKGKSTKDQRPLQDFYKNASEVLHMLELKAQKRYFQALTLESRERQEVMRRQNGILNEYALQLEEQLQQVLGKTNQQRDAKQRLLTCLGGFLGEELTPPQAVGAETSLRSRRRRGVSMIHDGHV